MRASLRGGSWSHWGPTANTGGPGGGHTMRRGGPEGGQYWGATVAGGRRAERDGNKTAIVVRRRKERVDMMVMVME